MERACYILTACIMSLLEFTGASSVKQSPPSLFGNPTDVVQLTCEHDVSNYRIMYWYQQVKGQQALELVGFLSYTDVNQDEKYKGKYNLTGSGENKGFLALKAEDSGTYFCAAEKDVNISGPSVKILQPSKKEIKGKRRVTLVCVATDFYPDHVKVTWRINGRDETSLSKMDESALQSNESRKYSITSRLRVTEKQWHNSRNRFQCSVAFFGGKTTNSFNATIQGNQRCGTTAEENKWSGNAAEFSYILVLVKSALFAAFLTIFVFKLKGTRLAQFRD